MKVKCPTCKKSFEYKKSEFRPFCTQRCKEIDLGHWFSESYGIKSENNLSEEDMEKVISHHNEKAQ